MPLFRFLTTEREMSLTAPARVGVWVPEGGGPPRPPNTPPLPLNAPSGSEGAARGNMRTPQGSTHENEEKRRGDGGGGEPCGAPKVSDQKILHQGAPHDTAPQPTPPEATTNPLPAAALASDTARAAKNLVSTDSPARSSRPISSFDERAPTRQSCAKAGQFFLRHLPRWDRLEALGSFSSDTCPGGMGWKPSKPNCVKKTQRLMFQYAMEWIRTYKHLQ